MDTHQAIIPNLLQLPTQKLLDDFGAGSHKPGSGSAAALLGLLACKMMETVISVTRRHPKYSANIAQLGYIDSILVDRSAPFFRDAVQRDTEQFHRYILANNSKKDAKDESEKRRYSDLARQELIPATEIPLDIATHAAETAERGLIVYDLGVKHARGDSGVAISASLSSCSGALFIVYLNLLHFREGAWAAKTRTAADRITGLYQRLQFEQFKRVSRIQGEGINNPQIEMQLDLELLGEEHDTFPGLIQE